jgi:hypothetical protein
MLASINGYVYYAPDNCEVGDLAVIPPAMWNNKCAVWRVNEINASKPDIPGLVLKSVVDIIKTKEIVTILPNEEKIKFLKEEASKLGYRLVPKKKVHSGMSD